jgi:hypothetical protein
VPPRADLASASLWQATVAALRVDFGTLFALAAPFTLLVSMLLSFYGPPPPATPAELDFRTLMWLLVVPSLVGAIGQLAVARSIARPGEPPRAALARAFAVLPGFAGALVLASLVGGFGLLLFVAPGLYITARFLPLLGLAAVEGGSVAAMLRRCWAITEGRGMALTWFLLLALLFLLGAAVLVAGAGAAVSAVATLVGLHAVGHFLSALAEAGLGTLAAMAYAAAATVIYTRLAIRPV